MVYADRHGDKIQERWHAKAPELCWGIFMLMKGFQKVKCWDFEHKRNKVVGRSTSAENEPAASNDKPQRRSDYLIEN